MKAQQVYTLLNEGVLNKSIASFEEIIEEAIEHERQTYRQYIDFSKLVSSDLAKQAFVQLAHEELKHAEILEHFLDRGYEFFTVPAFDESLDFSIIDQALSVELHPDMNLGELLLFAIRQEYSTFQAYKEMARKSQRKIAHDTFVKLARLEFSHASRLLKIYKDNFSE